MAIMAASAEWNVELAGTRMTKVRYKNAGQGLYFWNSHDPTYVDGWHADQRGDKDKDIGAAAIKGLRDGGVMFLAFQPTDSLRNLVWINAKGTATNSVPSGGNYSELMGGEWETTGTTGASPDLDIGTGFNAPDWSNGGYAAPVAGSVAGCTARYESAGRYILEQDITFQDTLASNRGPIFRCVRTWIFYPHPINKITIVNRWKVTTAGKAMYIAWERFNFAGAKYKFYKGVGPTAEKGLYTWGAQYGETPVGSEEYMAFLSSKFHYKTGANTGEARRHFITQIRADATSGGYNTTAHVRYGSAGSDEAGQSWAASTTFKPSWDAFVIDNSGAWTDTADADPEIVMLHCWNDASLDPTIRDDVGGSTAITYGRIANSGYHHIARHAASHASGDFTDLTRAEPYVEGANYQYDWGPTSTGLAGGNYPPHLGMAIFSMAHGGNATGLRSYWDPAFNGGNGFTSTNEIILYGRNGGGEYGPTADPSSATPYTANTKDIEFLHETECVEIPAQLAAFTGLTNCTVSHENEDYTWLLTPSGSGNIVFTYKRTTTHPVSSSGTVINPKTIFKIAGAALGTSKPSANGVSVVDGAGTVLTIAYDGATVADAYAWYDPTRNTMIVYIDKDPGYLGSSTTATYTVTIAREGADTVNQLFAAGREGFLDGTIDWDTDTIKVALVRGTVPNVATQRFLADITTAGGTIVARSGALTGKTVAAGIASADQVIMASVPAGAACPYLVLYKDTGADGTSRLIQLIDTGGNLPITPNGGNVTITWPPTGNRIFKL